MKPLKQALAVLAILVGGGLALAAQQPERVPPPAERQDPAAAQPPACPCGP